MSEPVTTGQRDAIGSFLRESLHLWRSLPLRGAWLIMLGAWFALFQFFGNSTFGLVNTRSLFGWWLWTIDNSPDEKHAYFVPLIVLGLLLWKRKELEDLPKRPCWLALVLFVFALLLHLVGYVIQQARVSFIAFGFGLYALTGLVWGGRWLYATLFPFSLLVFAMPLGPDIERLTFPLRLLATKITVVFSGTVLGIPVVQLGTRLLDSNGAYAYDVAPACSGIRSLTAIIAFSMVYGFITFKTMWRRSVMVVAAIPLAVAGNVFRLLLIVVAAEAFGQQAGNYVHASDLFSMAPYVPPLVGMLALGYWLEEDRKKKRSKDRSLDPSPASLLIGNPEPKP
jgi:exosortase